MIGQPKVRQSIAKISKYSAACSHRGRTQHQYLNDTHLLINTPSGADLKKDVHL